jgi:hypothetical protein
MVLQCHVDADWLLRRGRSGKAKSRNHNRIWHGPEYSEAKRSNGEGPYSIHRDATGIAVKVSYCKSFSVNILQIILNRT